jgi:hypothetical protein
VSIALQEFGSKRQHLDGRHRGIVLQPLQFDVATSVRASREVLPQATTAISRPAAEAPEHDHPTSACTPWNPIGISQI